MKVARPFCRSLDLNPLQDLALERGPQTFDRFEAVIFGGLFEFSNGADTQLLVQFHHLVRPKSGDGKQFENSLRYLCAKLFQRGVRAIAM
jgi:hypothetical protein